MSEEENDKPPEVEETFVPPESFGDYLKRQREASGKSLQEVAAVTKISRRYLQAFEENDIDEFPAKTFTRGFLRNYAEEVGIDVDECLERYDLFQRSLMPTQVREAKREGEKKSTRIEPDEKTAKLNRVLFFAGALGILLIGLALYFLSDQSQSDSTAELTPIPEEVIEEAAPDVLLEPVPEEEASVEETAPEPEPQAEENIDVVEPSAPIEEPELVEEEPVVAVPVTPSILEVEALEDTSLQIRLDGAEQRTIRLEEGDRETFSVRRDVEIRNIRRGSLNFRYNGKSIEVAGQMIKLFNRNLFNTDD